MLLYLRHGKTGLNLGGSEEKLRGWLPVPLTNEGRAQATAAGRALKGTRIDSFVTSDLPRAVESANLVADEIGMKPTIEKGLRDWNTGRLAGKKFDDVKHLVFDLVDHPDRPAPGGESLNDYLNRFVPATRQRVYAPGNHLGLGHARGATILQGIASPVGGVGQDIDPKYLKQRPSVGPGELLTAPNDWKLRVINHYLTNLKAG